MDKVEDQQKYPHRYAMCDGGRVYEDCDCHEVEAATPENPWPTVFHAIEERTMSDPPTWATKMEDEELTEYIRGVNEWLSDPSRVYTSASFPVFPETRVTDPETGGEKGEKLEEYAYIPSEPLAELARVYGMGAKKYAPFNWSKGYAWRLSYSALFRHIEAHRGGESVDPQSGLNHLAHAAFHLFTLMEFERLELGTDDRWVE